MDSVTRELCTMAKQDADSALRVLSMAAMGGPKAKPTMAELNEVMARLGNVSAFLASATKGKPA